MSAGTNGPVRLRGSVKWFNPTKGYGFVVSPTADGKDVFLHVNCLPAGVNTLKDGQPLSYVVENTRKGPRATNVQLEKEDSDAPRP